MRFKNYRTKQTEDLHPDEITEENALDYIPPEYRDMYQKFSSDLSPLVKLSRLWAFDNVKQKRRFTP